MATKRSKASPPRLPIAKRGDVPHKSLKDYDRSREQRVDGDDDDDEDAEYA